MAAMRHLRYVLGTHGPTQRAGGAHVTRATAHGSIGGRELDCVVLPGQSKDNGNDNVMKAWSLVSLLEAARALARLAFERSKAGSCTTWAAIVQSSIFFEPQTGVLAYQRH